MIFCGVEHRLACVAHNHEVEGSTPSPATSVVGIEAAHFESEWVGVQVLWATFTVRCKTLPRKREARCKSVGPFLLY